MPLTVDDPLPPDDWWLRRSPDIDGLYRAQGPKLARYFARRVAREDVFDLVQETFRRLIGAAPGHRARLDSPEAYLQRVAGNLVRDRSRSSGQRAAHAQDEYEEEAIAGPDPHGLLEDRDTLARIDAALAKLKPKTREIFMLHRLDGLSYAEIADRMGMSIKGVEYQLAKALDELRRRVGRR